MNRITGFLVGFLTIVDVGASIMPYLKEPYNEGFL